MTSQKLTAICTIISIVIILSVAAYINVSYMLGLKLALISFLAFIFWLYNDLRNEQYLRKLHVVSPYLFSIVLILAMNTCRYWSNYVDASFEYHFNSLNIDNISNTELWFLLNITFFISIFLFGGYLLIKQHLIGTYIAWWLFISGITESVIQIMVELTAYSSYVHHFFVACAVAVLLIILSLVGIKRLIKFN